MANICYDADADDYFKFQNIDRKILKHSEKVYFPSYFFILFNFYLTTDKEALKRKIFFSEESNTQYICYHRDLNGIDYYNLKKVNTFEPIRNNPDSENNDIVFKIKPASMRVFDLPVFLDGSSRLDPPLYYLRTQMPVVQTIPFNPNGNIDIQSVLEGEASLDISEASDIFVCFYNGKHTIFEPDNENTTSPRHVDYPMPFVDFLYEFGFLSERKINEDNLSLRLNHPDGFKKLYDQSIQIDTTREYTFKFISVQKLNAQSLFILNNKKFACKQFIRSINPDGADPIIEGVFYAID